MFARLPKILIALALASSIGLHWAFLQAVAWTEMVITYSQDGPVVEAIAKTFDGNHPCDLCKQIDKGKRSERKTDYKFESEKLKFRYISATVIFTRPATVWKIAAPNELEDQMSQAPPVPPPRSLPI